MGSNTKMMLASLIHANPKILSKAGLSMADIDTFAIDEAFVPNSLVWRKLNTQS